MTCCLLCILHQHNYFCRYINSSVNDLNYWGIDYPPLTAYHSWIMGMMSAYLNPDWIILQQSRGYENYSHKLFMRSSVLLSDILIYFTAVVVYVCFTVRCLKSQSNHIKVRYIYVRQIWIIA